MTQVRTYEGVALDVVMIGTKPWFTAADIAKALGYAQARNVMNLYARNADEFDGRMTCLVDLTTGEVEDGGVVNLTMPMESQRAAGAESLRLFSLRGAHLLGMLADTEPAKAFRSWVLDVLDAMLDERPPVILGQPVEHLAERPGSRAERAALNASVFYWMDVRARADAMIEAQTDALAKGSKRLRDE